MIEFKRAGDVMVFECPSFTIKVCADSERIAINDAAANDPRAKEVITDAFEVLDMMIEHEMRRTNALKVDFDIAQVESVDIETLRKRLGPNYTY